MPLSQLRRIEVQGFRSFGAARQAQDLSDTVSCFWGGNSQGKTSLAEAFEFLLTGQTSRREILASAKDEFAEALRNAHLAPSVPVQVEARIACPDGQVRRLTRTLVEDYKRGGAAGCTSRVEIDGAPCTEADLELRLGLRLSHPPLRAPVLAQHTLGYLFTASPADRAAYFRALLDTQDVEDFRSAVATMQSKLTTPILPALQALTEIEEIPEIVLEAFTLRGSKTVEEVEKNLLGCVSGLLTALGITPAANLASQAMQLDDELQKRRALTFPIALFGGGPFSPWVGFSPAAKTAIEAFLTERGKVAEETRRLVEFFKAALALPALPAAHTPIDCPLCEAEGTLTPVRVEKIREQVQATSEYRAASDSFEKSLRELDGQLEALSRSADQNLPKFLREPRASRRPQLFTISRIRDMVKNDVAVSEWLRATAQLLRATRQLKSSTKDAREIVAPALASPNEWNDAVALERSFANILNAQERRSAAYLAYQQRADAVYSPLKSVVDLGAATKGWAALIDLAPSPSSLHSALTAVVAHKLMITALEKALREIDTAIGKVADEKFSDLSDGVRFWWNKLRPDEPVFFDGVRRRGEKTRRTIDLKAGLSAKEDRSDPKFRDAVAVFSQSQLHCLGLSLFLARAVQDQAGFIILDDPVLTSDDDFKPNFVTLVVEGLLNAGIQVIVLTQDDKTWKDIGHRYSHCSAIQLQLLCETPTKGTELHNIGDHLGALIAKAQPYLKWEDPEVRKQGAGHLRIATERFAKEILVLHRKKNGEELASITDYDGQPFSSYGPGASVLLTKNPAHPGKLTSAHEYVTPGPHDDTPPSKAKLVTANGDLKYLKKEYLG